MCNRTTITALALALVASASTANAELMFRGMPLYQQGNELISPVLGRPLPWGIDVSDDFNRQGLLGNTEVDGFQIGFVPPYDGVPDGPLTGYAAALHGKWMPFNGTEYITDQGSLRRATGQGVSVACLAWRVFPELGDEYLIQMTADVAEGEEVRLAYMGSISYTGSPQGFDTPVGQLVLSMERRSDTDNDPFTTAEDLVWTVSWDVEGNRQFVTGTTTAAVGEELNMQLGWLDMRTPGISDQFDAWLGTSQNNRRLSRGNMNIGTQAPIEVFGIGVEILGISASGTGSTIRSITGAVPEPATLAFTGLGLVTATFRRHLQRRR